MTVPFLGRLNPYEYVALVGSFILVGLEAVIRVLTLALPTSLLTLFYRASRRLFDQFTSPAEKRANLRRKSISTSVRNASDFVDMCALHGYYAEEHVIQTKDGYLLGLHRLAWRKDENPARMRVNQGRNSERKRIIYMHHGLLMNSEVWVCLTDAQRNLPFTLVEKGFDVWLGNNRGNKYSKKSIHNPPTSTDFWNFSMDEFAFHDIPDTISYILDTTSEPSLSYIGFSQGTAQGFATLSIHPKLNEKVNVFIALAPAMSPAGLATGVVDSLVKASPSVLFLLFGRRSILASASMWESILYPPIFVRTIDASLRFLFNWKAKNIATSQKLAAYPHLFSFSSTKSVVHWFQIMRNKCFQMYDDDVQTPITITTASKYTKVAKYPTRNIRTPVVLVYGGSDSLVDIDVMLRELPPQTVATAIPHYEHLDFLWARDVDTLVFPHVFDALNSFVGAEHTDEQYDKYHNARFTSLSASNSRLHLAHGIGGSDTVCLSDVSTALNSTASATSTPDQLREAQETRESQKRKEAYEIQGSQEAQKAQEPTSNRPREIQEAQGTQETQETQAAQEATEKAEKQETTQQQQQPLIPQPSEEDMAASPERPPPGPASRPTETPRPSTLPTEPPLLRSAKVRGTGARKTSLGSSTRLNFERGLITPGASNPGGGVQTEGGGGQVSPTSATLSMPTSTAQARGIGDTTASRNRS